MMTTVYLASLPAGLPKQARPKEETRLGRALLAYGLMKAGAIRRKAKADLAPKLRFGPRGKPELVDVPLCFNISHSKGLVACALGDRPLGLDVEQVRAFRPELLRRVWAPGEESLAAGRPDPDQVWTQLWTCKESYMKYTGLGMAQGAGEIPLAALGPRPRLRERPELTLDSVPLRRGEGAFWLTLCREESGPWAVEFLPRERLEK